MPRKCLRGSWSALLTAPRCLVHSSDRASKSTSTSRCKRTVSASHVSQQLGSGEIATSATSPRSSGARGQASVSPSATGRGYVSRDRLGIIAGSARLISTVRRPWILSNRRIVASWGRIVVAAISVRAVLAVCRAIVVRRRASAVVVSTESGIVVGIRGVRIQLRRLLLKPLGLGTLAFGLRHAGLRFPLGLRGAKLRVGTFPASCRSFLVRCSLGRFGLSS
jgi:hypothetical protein